MAGRLCTLPPLKATPTLLAFCRNLVRRILAWGEEKAESQCEKGQNVLSNSESGQRTLAPLFFDAEMFPRETVFGDFGTLPGPGPLRYRPALPLPLGVYTASQ